MSKKPLTISESAAVQMPMKTVASLIMMVAIGTWAYFGLHETLNKHSTQLELVKECKRVPRIKPVTVEFAELINMCMKLGVVSNASYNERDFDPKISYWTVLKEKYMKENPGLITLDNYKGKK